MKRTLILFFIITIIITLIGCSIAPYLSDKQVTDNNSPKQLDPLLSSEVQEEKKYTEDDAIAEFKADKNLENCEIIECVLKNNDEVPILKAVISFYNKEENNSCNLAFICEDSIQKICFAVNEVEGIKAFEIIDNSHLTYIGNGAITTSIRKIETNEILDYTIIFSYEKSTSTSNIKVVSDKRTKQS